LLPMVCLPVGAASLAGPHTVAPPATTAQLPQPPAAQQAHSDLFYLLLSRPPDSESWSAAAEFSPARRFDTAPSLRVVLYIEAGGSKRRGVPMLAEECPIEAIRPYENNPRVNDSGVDAVATPVREFGFREPIVVDEQGVIIVGHVRCK